MWWSGVRTPRIYSDRDVYKIIPIKIHLYLLDHLKALRYKGGKADYNVVRNQTIYVLILKDEKRIMDLKHI